MDKKGDTTMKNLKPIPQIACGIILIMKGENAGSTGIFIHGE